MINSGAAALLFKVWYLNFAIATLRYLLAAGITVAVIGMFWKAGLKNRKIQAGSSSRPAMAREIALSIRSGLVFSVIGVGVYYGRRFGLIVMYPHLPPSEYLQCLGAVSAMILAHDTFFYWSHRLMHSKPIYKLVHRTHHKSVTPTAFAAYAFSVPEAVVQGLFAPAWMLLVPMHAVGLAIFLMFMMIRNVLGHSGVEFFPRWLADSRWFGWIASTTHHDMHHETFRHNYGLYFTWWDRIMGTEHPTYRQRLRGTTPPGYPAPYRPGSPGGVGEAAEMTGSVNMARATYQENAG